MLRDDESVKFYTGLPMVFASRVTVSSSCSTQLSRDINFVSSVTVTAAAALLMAHAPLTQPLKNPYITNDQVQVTLDKRLLV